MSREVDIEATLNSAQALLREAHQAADATSSGDEAYEHMVESCVHQAFLQVLLVAETISMPKMYDLIRDLYEQAKASKGGLGSCASHEMNYYSVWGGKLWAYVAALRTSFGLEKSETVQRDLKTIIRGLQYALTDARCFKAPANEDDVHCRSEMVLKCFFSDLQSKPSVSKPIKNFVPDTGIPSLRTLVEYKFVGNKKQVAPISDEILADTRGYSGDRWASFLYVIYETKRFKPESDWRNHLRSCGTAANTDVIVICGEPPAKSKKATRKQLKGTPGPKPSGAPAAG